jgi:hypothetical protein
MYEKQNASGILVVCLCCVLELLDNVFSTGEEDAIFCDSVIYTQRLLASSL